MTTSALTLKDPTLLVDKAYVAGEWIAAGPDGTEIRDPFDGTLIATVPSLTREDAVRAIDAAEAARPAWAALTAKERGAVLKRWHALILENAEDLAAILTAEQGKPLTEARTEIVANAGYIEWFAEEAKRAYGDVVPHSRDGQRILVIKQPVGTCAAITPWNFPNGMIARKVGPALAAGCAMVLKPAPQTPLSAFALALLAERAGLPKGLFSVITGEAEPIGLEFTHNPKVAKITFTGSTGVGRWLMRESAGQIKKLSLELGGNAPFIVFDDADLDSAVEGALVSKYRNAGQTCVCANRLYVQESVFEAFADKLTVKAKGLKLGRGTEAGTDMGPLINMAAVEKVEAHVADALEKGARLLTGGKRSELGGTFYEPTVVAGVDQTMRVAKEETFAPLAPLIPFKDEADVIAMANDTEFGLAAYFYARDMGRIFRVAEALETGMVGVNTGLIASETAPFGGVKQSGIGREGSKYGLDGYLEIKYICLGGV